MSDHSLFLFVQSVLYLLSIGDWLLIPSAASTLTMHITCVYQHVFINHGATHTHTHEESVRHFWLHILNVAIVTEYLLRVKSALTLIRELICWFPIHFSIVSVLWTLDDLQLR